MKVEIPEATIKNWHDNILNGGYDPPDTEKEWLELIKYCVNKEVGEEQFDYDWENRSLGK